MRYRTLKSVMSLAVALVVLSGCSSTGQITMQDRLQTRIDHSAVAALLVEPETGMARTEAVTAAERRLRGQLFGRLVSDGIFHQVVQPGEAAKYKIGVRLAAATEVSQTARILLGVLAGANELAVNVNVSDAETGAELTRFTVKGESATHPLSSENGMDDAISEVVDKVVQALSG